MTLAMAFSVPSYAGLIDFTGGTAVRTDTTTYVTDNVTAYDWQSIDYYVEDGFKFDFTSNGNGFATSVGNYFGNGSDVFHGHAPDLSLTTLTAVDGSSFDLNSFMLTTLVGVNVWSVNALKDGVNVSHSVALQEEDWGWGLGLDPIISLGAEFQNVKAVTFTGNSGGIGFDDFDVNTVPAPAPFVLMGLGLLGLRFSQRRNKA